METKCIPVCIACEQAGECNKVWKLKRVPIIVKANDHFETANFGGASLRASKNAAIEKGLAAYIHLACGHLTTRECQVAYAIWKPKGKDFYCEECHKWVKRQPKPKPEPLPDTPLF